MCSCIGSIPRILIRTSTAIKPCKINHNIRAFLSHFRLIHVVLLGYHLLHLVKKNIPSLLYHIRYGPIVKLVLSAKIIFNFA